MVIKHGIYLIPNSLLDIWFSGQLLQTERHCGWRRLEAGEKEHTRWCCYYIHY